MNVLCSNINGLRNNFTELKQVANIRKPDVFFLNETHVTTECDTSDLKLHRYDFVNCPSHSKHTGGVCVFINNKIKYHTVTLISNDIYWLLSFEMYINKQATVIAGAYLSANNEHKH